MCPSLALPPAAVLATYLKQTHAATHSTYTIELEQAFEVEREGEAARFDARCAALGNRRLLWHGTDVGCAAAIVARGLRVMPGAGGRVGRGLYLLFSLSRG